MRFLTIDELAEFLTAQEFPAFAEWAATLQAVQPGRTFDSPDDQAAYNEQREARRARHLKALLRAAENGTLIVIDGVTRHAPADLKRLRTFVDVVSEDDANQYLRTVHSPHRVGKEAATPAAWKDAARKMADQIVASEHGKNFRSSRDDIAEMIARRFEKEGTRSEKGKPLAGSYIRRHALRGWKRRRK